MILPIYGIGQESLRLPAKEIFPDYPGLPELIDNMFETMYNAQGVGLAAPQIGLALRIFVVDGTPMEGLLEDDPESMIDFKRVFINPIKIEETGDEWAFEEGCLSIPDIRETVYRKNSITLKYLDKNFNEHVETLLGLKARIVQHEYDHLEGILFTDHISRMRKKLLKSRLNKISKGQIPISYPMKFKDKKREQIK